MSGLKPGQICDQACFVTRNVGVKRLQPKLEGELDLYKSQIGDFQDTLEKIRVMLLARQAQRLANRSQLPAMNSWASTLGQTR